MATYYTTRATIVIPLRVQRASWLEQSVRSALEQSVPCDVIVVASHDTPAGNHEVLSDLRRRYERLQVLVAPERCGYACAFNLGIRRAATERVGFLLADDWLEPGAVERCLAHPEDIVSTRMSIYAADGATLLEIDRISNEGLARRHSAHEKADYLGHFLLLKREVLLAVDGVDPAIGSTGPDDYDLLWTLLERGASATVVESALYNYRDHDEEWRLCLRPPEEQLRNLEKILDKHGLAQDIRPSVRQKHGRWYGKTIAKVRDAD